MKNSILWVLTFVFILYSNTLFSQSVLPAGKLQEDYAIVEKAFKNLHPGLYKHADSATVQANFDQLRNRLSRDLTLAEAYLAFSKFTAGIQCGHTYCNFWNQGDQVKQALFAAADKVPFTFKLIGRRMLLVKNLSGDGRLERGVEILSINGHSIGVIIDSLLTVVSADGGNESMRMHALQLEGTGDYEWFDVFFPLFFPPVDGVFQLEVNNLLTNTAFFTKVKAISRSERFAKMKKQYGPLPESYDDLWEFRLLDRKIAYLKLGTFVTYKMNLDWKQFIRDAFAEVTEKHIPNLIIDIRGNAGGMDNVSAFLGDYIVTQPVELPAYNSLVHYKTVAPELRPYLDTWDRSFYDFKGKVKPMGNGLYIHKKSSDQPVTIKPKSKAYRGRVWLLIDGANSSATFTLAHVVKQNGLGTLVGQPTGGNRKGINGGGIFFLTLPHSGIELDIPIFGGYPVQPQPDGGIEPDILVEPNVADVINGVDTVLEETKKRIAGGE